VASFCDSYAVGDVRTEQVYAYEIRKFSDAGQLLMVIDRENTFMGEAEVVRMGDAVQYTTPTASYGFCVLSDGTIPRARLVPDGPK